LLLYYLYCYLFAGDGRIEVYNEWEHQTSNLAHFFMK
jgi:hypothetical protein